MFIDSSIALLGLQFPYILFAIPTFVAPGDVNGVFGAAVGTLSDVESLLAGSVVEHVRIDDMGTAFGVASASTRGTSTGCRLCSDDLAICESCLSEQVAKISVSAITDSRFLREFPAFGGVDL